MQEKCQKQYELGMKVGRRIIGYTKCNSLNLGLYPWLAPLCRAHANVETAGRVSMLIM